jgi:hypothetical protein
MVRGRGRRSLEELLATIGLIVVMVAGLVVVARGWPSSYRSGGFRAWMRGGSDAGSSEDLDIAEERGTVEREDDDVRWHWNDQGRDGDA